MLLPRIGHTEEIPDFFESVNDYESIHNCVAGLVLQLDKIYGELNDAEKKAQENYIKQLVAEQGFCFLNFFTFPCIYLGSILLKGPSDFVDAS